MMLDELLNLEDLRAAIDGGYVTERRHQQFPYSVLNYTPKAQYDNMWTAVTVTCRGLIYNTDTGVVVARPFPKFFNYDQLDEGQRRIFDAAHIIASEKVDGSLGILYPTPDGELAVATRGSFHSEQAQHATALIRSDRFAGFHYNTDVMTVVVEIVYPANRIVVDYGQVDDLVYLAALDVETNRRVATGSQMNWPGRVADLYGFSSIHQTLAAPQQSNSEGFVVEDISTGLRCKLKFDEYKRLHRILTSTNARTIWRVMAAQGMAYAFTANQIAQVIGESPERQPTFDQLVDMVPDEFYNWVHHVCDRIQNEYDRIVREVMHDWGVIAMLALDGKVVSRADAAREAKKSKYAAIMFKIFDDKDYDDIVWRMVKPEHEMAFMIEGGES